MHSNDEMLQVCHIVLFVSFLSSMMLSSVRNGFLPGLG